MIEQRHLDPAGDGSVIDLVACRLLSCAEEKDVLTKLDGLLLIPDVLVTSISF
jgi:hypothetical protein